MDALNTKIKEVLQEKTTKIIPGNIKKDVNILGITGSYEGNVPSGTINIVDNGIVDVTNYASANVNVQAISNYNATMLTSVGSYFEIRNLIVEMPTLDFTGITSLNSTFTNFAKLKKINLTGTNAVTSWFKAFYYCTDLEDVAVMDTSSATNFNNSFAGCTKLTNDSLNNIMQMCINATNYTNTKTLVAMGLSSTQATTCQSLGNYQAFLNAGWTTGY